MATDDTTRLVGWFRGSERRYPCIRVWRLTTLHPIEGVNWRFYGHGYGSWTGNSRTEELVIEAEVIRNRPANLVPLMALIRNIVR